MRKEEKEKEEPFERRARHFEWLDEAPARNFDKTVDLYERLLKNAEDRAIAAEKSLSESKAEPRLEVNLRPLIECEMRDWCKTHLMDSKWNTSTEANALFYL